MELIPDSDAPRWSDPRAAYAEYRPGLSPYLHYFHAQRVARDSSPGAPDHGPTDGAALPDQLEQALRDLIDESFG